MPTVRVRRKPLCVGNQPLVPHTNGKRCQHRKANTPARSRLRYFNLRAARSRPTYSGGVRSGNNFATIRITNRPPMELPLSINLTPWRYQRVWFHSAGLGSEEGTAFESLLQHLCRGFFPDSGKNLTVAPIVVASPLRLRPNQALAITAPKNKF
jgi:hypothetical protein